VSSEVPFYQEEPAMGFTGGIFNTVFMLIF
jgi:hypothetical protein